MNPEIKIIRRIATETDVLIALLYITTKQYSVTVKYKRKLIYNNKILRQTCAFFCFFSLFYKIKRDLKKNIILH